ncbi:F-type conjugative transfer protein TrbC [Citrobacter freundii complex sp. 2024EL-00228]|uniref:TraM recognition domain-containing protein n=2 Tax=Citrobacter freundii complex TaxID=1344959 RepID=A0AAD2XY69_CITFR|nr:MULTISPECIES: F-type conjugative transfer protein TrbC [Citrobacter freundii complex]ELC6326233.1 TraM recognition domain-containing protein [Enterobacter hormaechei]HEF0010160.1 TraM recognition domain-containing protein [Citrobacter braakii]EKU3686323.1 TraM recognition domain-containing protein [Citrobacter freundii]EKU8529564.1 TraM recognition domain-containing protein [Citrobacter freundii]EKU8678311.1 TraM recognition domain-containing protein [Citrobacter freundii]
MNNTPVNQALMKRNAWNSPVLELMRDHLLYAGIMAGSVVAGFIWPLAIPLFLLLAIVASISFGTHRWRMPMRMPVHLNKIDPSEDRKVRRSFFRAFPSLFQYETTQESKGKGIFYIGYKRMNDIGRELWLTLDDLTRHVMFFASTGGGKTETIYAWMLNSFCWGRGFTFVDGKAQNDTARTCYYLARRFGREDDVEYINFMNSGMSRSEMIQNGDKSRPQSHQWNPFCYSTEAFVAETMQSMLPTNVQGGEWQSRAIAMNKALVFGTKFYCVRENKTMSLQLLREFMPLEKLAGLYCRAVDDQWPEEAVSPLYNYLVDVPGFDMATVRQPSAWTEEPRKQHSYLTGQFLETFNTFTETFGNIFAEDAGDIDIRDSIHSDRILLVLIPAMNTSQHTTSALGRMFVTQQSMILARDLGHKLEGLDSEALEITKYKGKFPYMNYLDEVGAYYTERIAVQATQVRSLEFALVMMSQDQERIENQTSAANVATLMQNAGTKVAGKIVSDDKTARTISNAAGQEARANMVSLQRQDGLIGTSWIDGDHINIQMENKINVQDLIKLQPGENYTVFQGDPVPGASFYIEPQDKTCNAPVIINRYITINPPNLKQLRKLVPRTAQRRLPAAENVSKIIGVLTEKPSRRRKAARTEPWKIIDTFQQRLANRQEAHNLMTEYDMDHGGREENLWAEALEIIRTTTMAERTIRYITLNKPESESTEVNAEEIQLAPDAILRNLTLPQPAYVPPARHRNEPFFSPKQTSSPQPDMEWPE